MGCATSDLNERERKTLFQLAEMVDGNPRQFERLIFRDDLNDTQMSVMKKLTRDNDRRAERGNEEER